jgi:formylmethanofuran dehydrogenase subunit E
VSEHATVSRDGYSVPLIGVPVEATSSECDLCHDTFHVTELEWSGSQMLCAKCRKEATHE